MKSLLDKNVSIGDESRVIESEIGENCKLGRRNVVVHSKIGKGSYTGDNANIKYSEIGKYCPISWNVSIGGANHDIKALAMTPLNQIFSGEGESGFSSWINEPCKIGNDVWIAAGAHILRGTSVGDGAVIAASAVVTKDIPPYAIVAGVPAKIIGYRFSENMINRLLKIKWWDFGEKKLKKCQSLFEGILTEEAIDKLELIKNSIDEV